MIVSDLRSMIAYQKEASMSLMAKSEQTFTPESLTPEELAQACDLAAGIIKQSREGKHENAALEETMLYLAKLIREWTTTEDKHDGQ